MSLTLPLRSVLEGACESTADGDTLCRLVVGLVFVTGRPAQSRALVTVSQQTLSFLFSAHDS
eukprot:1582671-Rhodomonas_salina.1